MTIDRATETVRRPDGMALDVERCIECGTCDALLPGIMNRPERIAISQASLEAMALCPVGALRWLEGLQWERKGDQLTWNH